MRRVPVLIAATWAIALLSVAGLAGAASSVARADEDGTDLSVTVISTSPTASATASATPTATATSSSTATSTSTESSSGTTSGTTTTDPTATTPGNTGPGGGSGGDGELGGVVYVSGLSWFYSPSLNPFDGTAELRFTVRNVHPKTLDASATFWVTNLFGGTVGTPVTVAIGDLKSNETRLVSARLGGLAQWTILTGHATFTPPEKLGDVVLAPVNRESTVWFVPWAIVALAGLVGAVLGLRGWRLRLATPVPTPAEGAA
ncbi:hypothetical protein PROP_02651 [Propionicimonas sp. T2.31MG-18]|uniref:hypothetical protein n=1 Tax=Propionicimonas sp. T2.31MG-18 TaxID=3157620 RepID=UPI0035E74AFE